MEIEADSLKFGAFRFLVDLMKKYEKVVCCEYPQFQKTPADLFRFKIVLIDGLP